MTRYASSVSGTFNYAADKNNGGVFSNTRPDRTNQKLQAVDLDVRNARMCPKGTSLNTEGLALVEHSAGKADWSSQEWIQNEYVPSCLELVKRLTGAKNAVHIFAPLQRRVDFGNYQGAAPTAGFLHIDLTRETALNFATQTAEAMGISFKRAVIFNVWKCMTPAPQDYPLAVADRRTIAEQDLVYGETVEYYFGEGGDEQTLVSPYYVLSPSAEQVFYYYPDMNPDESLVFVGVDLDASNPLGCAHSAFKFPDQLSDAEPRASIETRVLAIFE